jgi:hypothetical protein
MNEPDARLGESGPMRNAKEMRGSKKEMQGGRLHDKGSTRTYRFRSHTTCQAGRTEAAPAPVFHRAAALRH